MRYAKVSRVVGLALTSGRFADKHLPKEVTNIIICEAGERDDIMRELTIRGKRRTRLSIPIPTPIPHTPTRKYTSGPFDRRRDRRVVRQVTMQKLTLFRIYNIILYQVLLSCVIGAIIGYIARKVLRFAEEKK